MFVHTCSGVLRCDMLCDDCDAVRYRICITEGYVAKCDTRYGIMQCVAL